MKTCECGEFVPTIRIVAVAAILALLPSLGLAVWRYVENTAMIECGGHSALESAGDGMLTTGPITALNYANDIRSRIEIGLANEKQDAINYAIGVEAIRAEDVKDRLEDEWAEADAANPLPVANDRLIVPRRGRVIVPFTRNRFSRPLYIDIRSRRFP